jgi:hypothetical protein
MCLTQGRPSHSFNRSIGFCAGYPHAEIEGFAILKQRFKAADNRRPAIIDAFKSSRILLNIFRQKILVNQAQLDL